MQLSVIREQAVDIRAAVECRKSQYFSQHASKPPEHRDLADDEAEVADIETPVQVDNMRVSPTPDSEAYQDTATNSDHDNTSSSAFDIASQSQAEVVTNQEDEVAPLSQEPDESEDAEMVESSKDMSVDKAYDMGGGRHDMRAGVHNYAVDMGHAGSSRMHFGDVYNTVNNPVYNYGDKLHRTTEKLGIEFSLSIHDVHARGSSSGDVSTFKKRTMYVSKKQQPVSDQTY
jgi:hypothetical protein